MRIRYAWVSVLLVLCVAVCAAQTTVNYQPSTLDFPNPERGFYRYSETRASNYTPLNVATLVGFRQNQTPGGGTYQVASTLVFRYFFLDDFTSSNISASFLSAVQADFDAARIAGVKLIPRFAYTDEVNGNGCGSFICPPYGDAEKQWVLTHIQQLAPVLQSNEDVIAAVQMGFIGTWGENYYTDYFGDASQAPDFKLFDDNWLDRIDVLNALLGAVPTSRSVQVRYPQMKQRAVYGVTVPTTAAALVLAEAYSGSSKARIGFHNDCLLASADDFGTYNDYGNTSTPSQSDTAKLKPYAAADGAFVPVGGETCNDGYSPQNDCAGTDPIAFGDEELRRFHYSYLNADYNNEVNNDWQAGGCMDAIKLGLGYRIELQDGTYTDAAATGQTVAFDLGLRNLGYAAPFNAREVDLVLRHTTLGTVYTAPVASDPRYWFGDGAVTSLTEDFCLPSGMPAGEYVLLLHLPDPMLSLRDRPAYAMRLANLLPNGSDPWEANTGYNDLGHRIAVGASGSRPACGGETVFAPVSGPLPIELTSFTAEAQGNDVLLQWATASEVDHRGFGLERSTDGASFTQIAFVEGLGTASTGAQYAQVDDDVQAGAIYYFRLVIYDNDGAVAYSETVVVDLMSANAQHNTLPTVVLSPNPADGLVQLSYPGGRPEGLELSLYNVQGEQVATSTSPSFLDVSPLPNGLYTLQVRTEDGVLVHKLVVAHD